MTDLGALNGDDCSIAKAINSRSQIVGTSFSCEAGGENATLWEKGSVIDLNSFVPPSSDLHLTGDDMYINERGEIAGTATRPDGDVRAFLLVPCEGSLGDDEECRDGRESIVAKIPAHSAHAKLTPERLAALRAGLRRRHPFPDFGALGK